MNTRYFIIGGIAIALIALFFFLTGFMRMHRHKAASQVISVVGMPQATSGMIGQTVRTGIKLERINGKNLFHPQRGKPTDSLKDQKSQVAGDPKFELTGVFGYDEKAGAVISGSSRKDSRVFRIGDSLGDGFTLKEVQADKAVLQKGERLLTLMLKKDAKGVAAKQAKAISAPVTGNKENEKK